MSQYSIKDLEKLSGIKAHTIRIWEKRYALLLPERTDTNIRYYSDEDLRKILNVAYLVKSGMKISKVAQLCAESIRSEIMKIDDAQSSPNLQIDQLVRLMIRLDTVAFENVLTKIFSDNGTKKTVTKVLFPFMEKIGVLWQIGSIVPSHEHFVSNLIRNKLISETSNLPLSTSSKTILLFLKEDELHELSLLFINYMARSKGFETIYLGANVPVPDLMEISEKYKFETVATVFVNAITKETLEVYLQKLHAIFSNKKILVSGLQIRINNPEIPAGILKIDSMEDFDSIFQEK